MYNKHILLIAALFSGLLLSITLNALETNARDYEDRLGVASLVEKLRRGFQEQDVAVFFGELGVDSTRFERIKKELKAQAEEQFREDSTIALRSPYVNYYKEIEREFSTLFERLGNPGLKKPLETMKDTWYLDLEQKKLTISESRDKAKIVLLVGSTLNSPDSTVLKSISEKEIASLFAPDREKLLYYQPVELELVKIRNKWRVLDFNRLLVLKLKQ